MILNTANFHCWAIEGFTDTGHIAVCLLPRVAVDQIRLPLLGGEHNVYIDLYERLRHACPQFLWNPCRVRDGNGHLPRVRFALPSALVFNAFGVFIITLCSLFSLRRLRSPLALFVQTTRLLIGL